MSNTTVVVDVSRSEPESYAIPGKLCVEVVPTSQVAWISEELCIGCGICVKVSMQHGLLAVIGFVSLVIFLKNKKHCH